MKSYALDTNCFIDAFNPISPSHAAMQAVLRAAASHQVSLWVSRHTVSELMKDDAATKLAKSLPVLPHYPIGKWDEQVATWDQLVGTWEDARRNQEVHVYLQRLVKAGVGIRDRGGLIDAIANKLDGFVTSDKGLVAQDPASKINSLFATKVISPIDLAATLAG